MCRKMNLDSLSALIPLWQEEDRHFFFFPPAFIRLLLVRQDVGSEVCLWRLPPGFHFWALLGWGPHWCFKKKFIFTLFCFTLLYWFCHTLTWISHGCTWVPKPEPPSHVLPKDQFLRMQWSQMCLHPTIAKHKFFPCAHERVTQRGHILGPKTSSNMLEKD